VTIRLFCRQWRKAVSIAMVINTISVTGFRITRKKITASRNARKTLVHAILSILSEPTEDVPMTIGENDVPG
jgi:hypothetical protein